MENVQDFNFFREISQLISLQQEGEFWDFKKQWYTNKADMLHDIICMANNLCNHTAYIIIGIDEERGYSVCDVSDDPNRKNTQKIVDFLKDKKFAGGIRPIVYVKNLPYNESTIDIIVIENGCNTPFYLTAPFEKLRANNIYTRICDTNTPVDSSADLNCVERLWRKRFHLDETPIEKFRFFLKNPDDWVQMQDQNMGYYYKYSPEYTITCETDEFATGYEYYMFGQVDSHPNWWWITLKYHQTAIEKLKGLGLDGGRNFVVAPCRAYNASPMSIPAFGFFVQSGLQFQLLKFFYSKEVEEQYSFDKYMEAIVLFRTEREYMSFMDYLCVHKDEYEEYLQNYQLPSFANCNLDQYVKDYKGAIAAQQMLKKFRIEKSKERTEATHANT